MKKASRTAGKLPQDEIDAIAGRLRLSRVAQGLSSTELCERADIKRSAYSQWEHARQAPRLDQAKKLRKALGYTLDWIYEGDRFGLPMKLAQDIAKYENSQKKQPNPSEKVA